MIFSWLIEQRMVHPNIREQNSVTQNITIPNPTYTLESCLGFHVSDLLLQLIKQQKQHVSVETYIYLPLSPTSNYSTVNKVKIFCIGQ